LLSAANCRGVPDILRITARDVLFVHWPVPERVVRPRVPDALSVRTVDGTAWLSVVALQGVETKLGPAPGFVPPFDQVNLRTYVDYEGDPGVYFLSLDAGNRLAAEAGRRVWGLPFHAARIDTTAHDDRFTIQSTRRDGDGRFAARYRPTGDPFQAEPGSLAAELIERHRYYLTDDAGHLLAGEIERDPWTLYDAEATVRTNTLPGAVGVDADHGDPRGHYSPRFESRTGQADRVADARQLI
jgi:uncharacterized protein YqjF (DUF2071 family)